MARNTRTKYFPFGGGLDVVSPALSVPEGRALTLLNYEPWFEGGYRRIDGYERFDGRDRPHLQTFIGAELADTAGLSVDDVVTGDTSGASGTVVAIDGNWIALAKVTSGPFQQEALDSGTYTIVNQAPAALLAPSTAVEKAFLLAAQNEYRSDIAVVTGSGEVLGVWQRDANIYAVRDNAGDTAGILFRASASGWTTSGITMAEYLFFDTGGGGTQQALPAEGDTINGETSGATATVHRVIVHGGSVANDDAYGYLVVTSVASGPFNASENLRVSTTKFAESTTVNTTFALPADGEYRFKNHNFYGGASTFRTYAVSGQGPAFEIDENHVVSPILFPENALENQPSTNMPFLVEEHRNYLFLFFPGGYFAHSVPGEPMSFDGFLDAAEFGIGAEITGAESVAGNVLIVATDRFTKGLFGRSTSDWDLRLVGEKTGAKLDTLQQLDTVYGLGPLGVTSVSRTDQFGDFQGATVSQLVQPLINSLRNSAVCSTIVREANQYRVYFSDGTFFIMYVSTAAAIAQARGTQTPVTVEFGVAQYPDAVKRIFNCEDGNGTERIFFAADDGYVYEDRVGRNFDGESIESYLRLVYTHLGSPALRKKYRRLDIELSAASAVDVKVSHDLAYSSAEAASSAVAEITTSNVDELGVFSGAGTWDVSNWGEFLWDGQDVSVARAELSGTGEAIGLLFYHASAIDAPFVLQGATVHYDARRMQR